MAMISLEARPRSWLSSISIVYGCCLVVLLLSGLLIRQNITLWFDEATYFVNIRDADWRQLFFRLPFYDQAAPVGYSVLLKVIHTAFGMNEVLLRLPSFVALALVGMVAARFPGLSRLERALFCLLIMSSATVLEYSAQMKHYLWELFFIILIVYQNIPESPVYRRLGVRTLCLLMAATFSLQAVLVTAAVGMAAALSEAGKMLTATGGPGRTRYSLVLTKRGMLAASIALLPLMIMLAVEVLKYLLVTRESTATIFTNYRYIVDFGFPGPEGALDFYTSNIVRIVASHFGNGGYSILIFLPLLALGMVSVARRWRKVSTTFVLLIVFAFALNTIGFYPLMPGRFSLVLVPPLAFFMTLGASAAVEKMDGRAKICAVATMAVLCTIEPVKAVIRPQGQQARELVAAARSHLNATTPPHAILPVLGAQPLIDAYLGPFGDRTACVISSPGMLGMTYRCSELRQLDKDYAFIGRNTPWFVVFYIAHVAFGVPARDVDGPTIRQWTSDYIDFLFKQACGLPEVLVVASHADPSFMQPLEKRFARGGVLTREIDETRRGSRGGDGVVLRWRRSQGGEGGCDR